MSAGGEYGLFFPAIGEYFKDKSYVVQSEMLPGFNLHVDEEIKNHDAVIIYYSWNYMRNAHFITCEYDENKNKYYIYNYQDDKNHILEVDSISSYLINKSFDVIYYIDKE